MNTELRKNVKNEFGKDFCKLKINSIYGKTVQNDRKHRDIKLLTAEHERNKLSSETNYNFTKWISKHLLVMKMKKIEVKINKPIYLGQAVLHLSKTLMFEFWYDYLKPMYGDKIRLCYTDTDSFIMHIKTDDLYKDISVDVDKWFDTSNFNKNDNRPLEIGKNKKVLGKFKDEIGSKIMTKFCAFRAKTYLFLIDEYTDEDYEKNRIVNKKAKGTKKCVVKREILFNNYLGSLFKNEVLNRSQQRFRSDHHKVYTEEVNKIALSSNDDKRIQKFDKVTTYPYSTNIYNVCENGMLLKKKKVMHDQEKYRLGTDDYLSALIDHSKNLRRNIDTYNEKLKSINSKLSMVTHTSNLIYIYKYIYIYIYFSIKMGKTEAKNLDLKSKLSIVSSTIANATKDIESFKNEFNDFKSDHTMSKKGLNYLKNEFYDYLIMSLKVNDNLKKLNNDILMIKK